MTSPYKILTTDHLPKVRWQKRKYLRFWLTLQIGHTIQGMLQDCWTKMERLFCPFYGQRMERTRNYHILGFLHFTDYNRNGVDRKDDRLWKLRNLFEIIRTKFQNFTNLPNISQSMKSLWNSREVYYSNSTSRKTQTFRHQNVEICDSKDIHMTWIFALVKTDKGRNNIWQQPIVQWQVWQRR